MNREDKTKSDIINFRIIGSLIHIILLLKLQEYRNLHIDEF